MQQDLTQEHNNNHREYLQNDTLLPLNSVTAIPDCDESGVNTYINHFL